MRERDPARWFAVLVNELVEAIVNDCVSPRELAKGRALGILGGTGR